MRYERFMAPSPEPFHDLNHFRRTHATTLQLQASTFLYPFYLKTTNLTQNMENVIETNLYQDTDTEKLALIVKGLNKVLASYHLHYQKMRNFHWNVYGEHFFELHRTFEELYDDAKEKIDALAERILTLGHNPVSNFSEYLYISDIKEVKGVLPADAMAEETLSDFTILVRNLNECLEDADDADDEGTVDLLSDYIKQTEKKHWMFRAFIRRAQPQA